MNSSLRRALLNLDKSKEQQSQMEFQLLKILEPDHISDNNKVID